jgi:hypothetical protein
MSATAVAGVCAIGKHSKSSELLLQLRVCAWQMELVEAESDTSPNPPHKIQKDSNNPENRTWFSNPKSSSATPQLQFTNQIFNLYCLVVVLISNHGNFE